MSGNAARHCGLEDCSGRDDCECPCLGCDVDWHERRCDFKRKKLRDAAHQENGGLMLKDLCLGCGAEHPVVRPIDRSKTPCCESRRMVHQVECSSCKKVVLGYVVDDDDHGLDEAYCGECMSTARRGREASENS